ncbi:MAG: RraA family protein [Chloroflexi bacterium]|nr:RraA family protein [Chloroflexota bacterium]
MFLVNPPQAVIELTRAYQGERSPDGRPRVSDDLLDRMALVTTEEAWGVLRKHGYTHQFEGNWLNIHPDRILVGRAVTTAFVPKRPDLHDLVEEQGRADERIGGQNSWVIDTLVPGDVMVVDMFGKVNDGPFVGDNLATSVRARTRVEHRTTGIVIHGTIRDYQGVVELPDINIFTRGLHPSAIAEVTLLGINIPIQIGEVTVLPGDIVLGTPTGVLFIPPHLAQAVVERSEDIRVRDEFGHQRLREGRYTPGEIDRAWPPDIEADYQGWLAERRARP